MNCVLSQKHRHLGARKQVYKPVLEHEMKSNYLPAGACSLSDLTAETEVATSWCTEHRQGHCHLKSLAVEVHTCFLETSSCFLLLRSRAELWSDPQYCLAGYTAVTQQPFSAHSALHVSAVGVDPAGSWRRWDLGLGARFCRPVIPIPQWWEEAAGVAR